LSFNDFLMCPIEHGTSQVSLIPAPAPTMPTVTMMFDLSGKTQRQTHLPIKLLLLIHEYLEMKQQIARNR
jgi:hypothetical protein